MLAQNSQSELRNNFFHIHNKGKKGVNLFNDRSDYNTFVGFLKDYLSPPPDPTQVKTTFTVNGRTYKGIPHQPKNFNQEIKLIAFSLQPQHIHLLVDEIKKGTLSEFMRSLCTRYAIYYNKKYQRKGSVYVGPYKSIGFSDINKLVLLSYYLHKDVIHPGVDNTTLSSTSSYQTYIGDQENPWINSEIVLRHLENSEYEKFQGKKGYQKFVEEYELSAQEQKLLKDTIIEKNTDTSKQAVEESKETVLPEENVVAKEIERKQFIPEFVGVSTIVFLLLFTVGLRNVLTSPINKPSTNESPKQEVSGVSDTNPDQEDLPAPSLGVDKNSASEENQALSENKNLNKADDDSELAPKVVITVDDESSKVNIRSGPTTESGIVGSALDGEIFNLVSKDQPGWYGIKFEDKTTVYISDQYAEIYEGRTQ